MLSTYKLNTRDIDPFIAALQSAYPNQDVEITVQKPSHEEPFDETDYLDPANKAHLLQAVEDIHNGKNLVMVPHESDVQGTSKPMDFDPRLTGSVCPHLYGKGLITGDIIGPFHDEWSGQD